MAFVWYQTLGNGNQSVVGKTEDTTLGKFSNSQIEKAITDYLLTQEKFSWKTSENSKNFCTIDNLQPENELFPLYVWVFCGEYLFQDGELRELSGSSGPVKIDYPNELSFYDLNKFSYEAPGDGEKHAQDIKQIFPLNVQSKIFNYDSREIKRKNEIKAEKFF
jgi:hypothetical protein